MTKRRIERDLEELCIEVLSDLSAEDRFTAVTEAIEKDAPERVARLEESAPRANHSVRDPDYIIRRLAADRFAQTVVYELHRLLLEYWWRRVTQGLMVALESNGKSIDANSEPGIVLWQLLETVDAHESFVTEEFDVSLEEFVAHHSRGPDVLDQVYGTLAEGQSLLEATLDAYVTRRVEAMEESATESPDDDAATAIDNDDQ